jgi:hypothetical protein
VSNKEIQKKLKYLREICWRSMDLEQDDALDIINELLEEFKKRNIKKRRKNVRSK